MTYEFLAKYIQQILDHLNEIFNKRMSRVIFAPKSMHRTVFFYQSSWFGLKFNYSAITEPKKVLYKKYATYFGILLR